MHGAVLTLTFSIYFWCNSSNYFSYDKNIAFPSTQKSFHYKMIETDKMQVKELRTAGYSDAQLMGDMGFSKAALGMAPAVLKSS